MEIAVIPVENKFILYRPLLRRAFVGNQAMADLVRHWASQGVSPDESGQDALAFLKEIGFLEPDPPSPRPPDPLFHPTVAVVLSTSRCNLRCTYCYANGGSEPIQDVSLEAARVVIDQACRNALEQGHPHFDLGFHGGGEPVQIWDTLQQVTAYARSKELACHIAMVSNGIWTDRQREWILHNVDSLNISFDGQQETQNRQRPFASGQGSFRAVMHTIEALDRVGFSYAIRMTATAPWRGRLPEDVRFVCEKTGCPIIQVEPAFNLRRGEPQGPTQKEGEAFVEAFMQAFEIAAQAGRQLTYSGARPQLLTQVFCNAPYGALVVNPEGSLVACYEVTNKNHPMAQMFTVGCVEGSQIIIDDQVRHALWDHLQKKRATCQDCFCYWHCAGDCYPRSLAAAPKDPGMSNPRCDINREITARILLWYIMAGNGVWLGQEVSPQMMQLMQMF
ncbi:MAG: radical SAM protein [Anaerolineae bacterium]|nr:radical SAM protein [Anaerolineae bacterium]